MTKKTATKETTLAINPIRIESRTIRIVGTSPLIIHNWSEKAKKEMLDKQMKTTKTTAKEARNPIQEFIDSLYWITGKPEEYTMEAFDKAIANGATFGFPATAIKQASQSAAYRNGWVENQMKIRGAFFVRGIGDNQLVEIKGGSPEMREDMVKIGMGTADLRYRGYFKEWYMDLQIDFNASGEITLEQIVNFINAGGFCCGIGEWRPEKDGQYGTFRVEAIQ